MNLTPTITALIQGQNHYDSAAYARCFSEKAVVLDEGTTHTGRTEIKNWIEKANEKYRTHLEPIGFEETGNHAVLTAKVSGTFEGSPITMKYHLEIADGLIQSLKITG